MSFRIQTVHDAMACSTLLIGGFHAFEGDIKREAELLKKRMVDTITHWDKYRKETAKARGRTIDTILQRRSNALYFFEDYAYVMASVSVSQEHAMAFFEEMGFHKIPPISNRKNGTTITLWIIPAMELVTKLGLRQDKS